VLNQTFASWLKRPSRIRIPRIVPTGKLERFNMANIIPTILAQFFLRLTPQATRNEIVAAASNKSVAIPKPIIMGFESSGLKLFDELAIRPTRLINMTENNKTTATSSHPLINRHICAVFILSGIITFVFYIISMVGDSGRVSGRIYYRYCNFIPVVLIFRYQDEESSERLIT